MHCMYTRGKLLGQKGRKDSHDVSNMDATGGHCESQKVQRTDNHMFSPTRGGQNTGIKEIKNRVVTIAGVGR